MHLGGLVEAAPVICLRQEARSLASRLGAGGRLSWLPGGQRGSWLGDGQVSLLAAPPRRAAVPHGPSRQGIRIKLLNTLMHGAPSVILLNTFSTFQLTSVLSCVMSMLPQMNG